MCEALFLFSGQVGNLCLWFNWIDRIDVNERFLSITEIYPTFWRGRWTHGTISTLERRWCVGRNEGALSWIRDPKWIEEGIAPLTFSSEVPRRITHLFLFLLFFVSELLSIFYTLRLKLLENSNYFFNQIELKGGKNNSFPNSNSKSEDGKAWGIRESGVKGLIKLVDSFWNRS